MDFTSLINKDGKSTVYTAPLRNNKVFKC
uniref:30S ribosomal protein S11 n=1 Tax=Heterorhabditis bacteriophora TaxID=37862 RepID=A0A1I7WYI9_HETBA